MFSPTLPFRSPRPRAPRPEIVARSHEDFEAMEKAGLKHRLVHILDGKDTRNFGELHPNHPKDTVKRAVVASVVQTLPDGVIRCHNFEPGYSKKMCIVCRETAMFPFGVVNRQLGSFALGYRFPRTRTTCGSTRSRPPVAIVEGENNPSLTLIQSKEGRYMLFTKEESEEPVKHFLVANTGYSLRVCQYCKLKGDKFANGNTRQTYYKCDACGVHLCRPQIRDCFVNYHQLKFANNS
uniref:Uncharacterized protein n=1 Tax=Magallana gigas TaxID=29159 RepID=K1PRT1_MAGGI